MTKIAVTVEIDTDRLMSYTDEHLALLWHVGQANPAPIENSDAADVAESIGREIIRRWLKTAPVELWHHQGRHPYWVALGKYCIWNGKEWVPKGSQQ